MQQTPIQELISRFEKRKTESSKFYEQVFFNAVISEATSLLPTEQQYIQQHAEGFAEWIDANQYKCMGTDGDWREANGTPVAKSTEELYELYIQSHK